MIFTNICIGSTEVSGDVICHAFSQADFKRSEYKDNLLTNGVPIGDSKLMVSNMKLELRCPNASDWNDDVGSKSSVSDRVEATELWVSGPGIALGYLNQYVQKKNVY